MGAAKSLPCMGNSVRVDAESNTLEATRAFRESGNSIVLTIPQPLLEAAGMEVGDEVTLAAELGGDEISLRKAEPNEADDGESDDSSGEE